MPGRAAEAWGRLDRAMSTDKRRSLHAPPDPDDTAEMPGLPPADASTDTWAIPAMSAMPAVAAATPLDDVLQANLASVTANLRELEQRLQARDEQLRLVESERDELRSRLQRAQGELAEAAQRHAQQNVVPVTPVKASDAQALALAQGQADLAELQRRVARHQEALQHAEGRRYIFDSMLREREQLVDELALQVAAQREQQRVLEARLAQQGQQAQVQAQTLSTGGAAALARVGELEALLQEQRNGLAAAQDAALESQRRGAQLETEVADQGTVVRALREQLQVAESAHETLHGDLVAAEDLIRTREAELQQRDARLARLESSEAAGEPQTWLLVRTEGDSGIAHVLGRRTTVGRTPDNELRIDADFISRHHAVVLMGEGGTIVEDLDSTNGVFVNNVRVARRQLNAGDLVTFGKTTFRFLRKPVP